MRKLEGKTAVITGCSRGIGMEIMKLFVSQGANIIACSRCKNTETEKKYNELSTSFGVSIIPIYFDFLDEVSVKEGIKAIKSLKIPIDILVNNAGMGHLALLAFTKISDIHNVFQVNYFSQMMVTQGLLGLLSKSKNGSIINIASIAGIDGEIGNSVYGATKASMILFTKVLSKEVANFNVRVNAIAPGLTETDFSIGMGEKATQFMEQKSLMHRLAKPDEVANVALFLASDDSSFITGQVVRVDGGVY